LIEKKVKTFELIGAIAAVITIICTITTIVFSYLNKDEVTTNLDEFMIKISNHYTMMKTDAILSLICGVFLIPIAVGIFFFIRRKLDEPRKKFALMPLISIIFGSLIMISIAALQIYIVFYITPNYVGKTFTEQQYFLDKAIDVIDVSDLLSVLTHIIIFTIGAGSIGILFYNKKIIHDVFVWTALTSSVLGLAKIGIYLTGTVGTVFVFLASISSIFFYFFLGEMAYVIFRNHYDGNGEQKKSSIDASLLE